MIAGMKASPRFRESVANIRLRHQPAHIKYPLLQLHIVSNPDAYEPHHLNVRRDVRSSFIISTSPSSRKLSLSLSEYTP